LGNRLLGGGENGFKNINVNYKNWLNIATNKLHNISFAGLTTV
jgi:hypothetical protein